MRVVAAPESEAEGACETAEREGEAGGEVMAVDGRTSTTDFGLQALPTTKVNAFSVLFC